MKAENTSIRLKQIMQERQLRQVDILNLAKPYCEKNGVKMNKSDISQYVSGKVEPSQDKLVVLAMALNVSEAWLMGFDVPRENTLKSLKPFYDMLVIFDNHLELLGWKYELSQCPYWQNGGFTFSEDGEQIIPVSSCTTSDYGSRKCDNCPEKQLKYILTNGKITFTVSDEEWSKFYDGYQELFKNYVSKFINKLAEESLNRISENE